MNGRARPRRRTSSSRTSVSRVASGAGSTCSGRSRSFRATRPEWRTRGSRSGVRRKRSACWWRPTAREAVRLTDRALERARAAADQSNEVLKITDVAFREGATTNIEVIDAQRRARDADTIAVVAEDALRRARLDLLVALGRFPR